MNLYETEQDGLPTCLTTRQAIMRLGVSRSTFYRLRKRGVLQSLPLPRFKRSKLYNYDDIIKLAESAKKYPPQKL